MARSADFAPAVLASGSRVALVVSRGPFQAQPAGWFDVPSVVGMSQGAALSQLQDAGFQARIFNDYSDAYARGKVMGQVPSEGVNAAAGSEVVLMVSSGRATTQPAQVALPDVVGRPEADAVATLQAAGLSPQVTHEFSQTVPAGVVMAQLPSRASLAAAPARRPLWWVWLLVGLLLVAAAVAAYFLLQPGTTTVPDVVGMTQAEALTAIQDANLDLGSVTQTETTEVAEGLVAAQSPAGGEQVAEGTDVDLVIAGGEALVEVPDVVGMTQAGAAEELRAAGLEVSTRTQPSTTERAGTVLEQSPGAGERVPASTTIGLTIAEATEQQSEAVEMPDVTDVTSTDAESTLQDLGLRVVIVENLSAEVAEGVVITQLPTPGTQLEPGASVAIVVSLGSPEDATTVAVPNVVGMELPDAQEALAEAGLRSQPLAMQGDAENANDVLAQAPGGGLAVAPDSTIVLLYAR